MPCGPQRTHLVSSNVYVSDICQSNIFMNVGPQVSELNNAMDQCYSLYLSPALMLWLICVHHVAQAPI